MRGLDDRVFGGRFLIGAFVVILAVGFRVCPAQQFVWQPYLTNTTPRGTTVNWKASRATGGKVEYDLVRYYRKNDSLRWEKTVGNDLNTHHLRISNLLDNTTYAYRVVLTGGVESEVEFFSTFPVKEEEFSFLVYGDTRTFPDRHRVVAEAIAGDPSDLRFVLHTGDLVESPVGTRWNNFFGAIQTYASSIPLFPVLGNHEQNDDSYFEAFDLPPGGGYRNKRWYSFDCAGLHVVALDSNGNFGRANFIQQREWLEKDLTENDKPLTVVFFHHPIFSSVYSKGRDIGLADSWHPLFVEYRVDLVFSGHVHSYERIVKDGITYVVTGGGGAPTGRLESRISGSKKAVGDTLHYLRISISSDEIVGKMIEVARVVREDGTEGRAGANSYIQRTGIVKDSFRLKIKEKLPAS